MIDALGLEVAAIRKRGGGSRFELRGGERVGQAEDRWLYRFPLGEDLNLRDDTPVRLVCGDRETSGVLVSFREACSWWRSKQISDRLSPSPDWLPMTPSS